MDRQTSNISFGGGVNNGVVATKIAPEQSPDESGWVLDTNYPALVPIPGRSALGSVLSGTPRMLAEYHNSIFIRANGGTIQRWTGSSWSNIATGLSDTDWNWVNFEVEGDRVIIFTNGVDNVKSWDGSAFSDLSEDAPKGKFITTDNLRVWIAKDDVLHFSAQLKADDWTSARNSGFIQFYTPQGGDITALIRYSNRIVAFKSDAMSEIHGESFYDLELVDISMNIGCVNSKTIQEVQGYLLWLSETNVCIYTGGRPKEVGDNIKGFLSRINWAHIDKCFSGTDGRNYYLGLVTDNDTEPRTILGFDPKKGIWRVFSKDRYYRQSYLFNNEWYMTSTDGNTYLISGVTEALNQSEYIIGPRDEGVPQTEKEYYAIHIQGYIPEGSGLEVYVSRSERGDNFDLVDTVEGWNDDSQSSDIIVPLDGVMPSHWFRVKLVLTGPGIIYGAQLEFDVYPVQI